MFRPSSRCLGDESQRAGRRGLAATGAHQSTGRPGGGRAAANRFCAPIKGLPSERLIHCRHAKQTLASERRPIVACLPRCVRAERRTSGGARAHRSTWATRRPRPFVAPARSCGSQAARRRSVQLLARLAGRLANWLAQVGEWLACGTQLLLSRRARKDKGRALCDRELAGLVLEGGGGERGEKHANTQWQLESDLALKWKQNANYCAVGPEPRRPLVCARCIGRGEI